MKMTAAARATMHEMLTLPFSTSDIVRVHDGGSVWIECLPGEVSRVMGLFSHAKWTNVDNDLKFPYTVWHGISIHVSDTAWMMV